MTYFVDNQNVMSPAQKSMCQNNPHLFWQNNKTPGVRCKRIRAIIYDRDGGVCQICKEPVDLKDFTIDHIFPYSKGGQTTPLNLQLAHKSCNSRKSDSYVD